MLSITSSSESIMREIRIDYPKSLYWLKKNFGGDEGYDRMRDDLNAQAVREKKNVSSEIVEYMSPNKNKWIVFEQSTYYADANTSYCLPYSFCFYETVGSVCAFIPCFSEELEKSGIESCFIYTNHFFIRLCERLGIKMGSSNMIKNFIQCVPCQVVSLLDEYGENGMRKVCVRIPGSIGRGYLRPDANIYEIRTYLADKQLNGKQLRETESIREFGDKKISKPHSDRIDDIFKENEDKIKLNRFIAEEWSQKKDNVVHKMTVGISAVFSAMGIARENDVKFWMRFADVSRKHISKFVSGFPDYSEYKFLVKLIETGENIAASCGVKEFSRNTFASLVLNRIFGFELDASRRCANALFSDKTIR